MSEELDYNLRESSKKIGQLYPVLKDKFGNIIDGHHRKLADNDWREETLSNIDSREKLVIARMVANKQRRDIPATEVELWMNELAEIAMKKYDVKPGGIASWIAEQTSYEPRSIRRYLNDKFKLEKFDSSKFKEEIKGGHVSPSEPNLDSQLAVEAQVKHREIRELGEKIGGEIREALIQLDKDMKTAKPNEELVGTVSSLQLILNMTKNLKCPFHENLANNPLKFSCGHTLSEAQAEYRRRLNV